MSFIPAIARHTELSYHQDGWEQCGTIQPHESGCFVGSLYYYISGGAMLYYSFHTRTSTVCLRLPLMLRTAAVLLDNGYGATVTLGKHTVRYDITTNTFEEADDVKLMYSNIRYGKLTFAFGNKNVLRIYDEITKTSYLSTTPFDADDYSEGAVVGGYLTVILKNNTIWRYLIQEG